MVEDLFAVGLGFDIAGAYLLALGLLASPAQIAGRSTTRVEISSLLVVSQARDKVDGAIGIVALVGGFTLQAVAYMLTLGGHGSEGGNSERGLVALGLGLASVALVLIVWRLVRWPLLRKTLIDVARVNYLKRPAVIQDQPYGTLLVGLGVELGHEFDEGESSQAFVQRVFGVDVGPEIVGPREE